MAYERKVVDQGYPLPLFAAFVAVLCLAEHQPMRGRFRNERVLRALLGPGSRYVAELVNRGDLVREPGGALYVDGWTEWQEGDVTVGERVRLIRNRQGQGPATPGARRTANWRLRTRVFERDSFTCRYCGTSDYPREWLVLEHVIPDGPTTEDNLVTACRGCNKLKGGRTPEQAGMALRDASPVTGHGDASTPSDGGRLSVIDSADVAERTPPTPPRAGGRRADGTNERAIAAEITRRSEQDAKERKARLAFRQRAYLDGRITEAQRDEMNDQDAPLEEIPTQRGAAYQGAMA
jgi:hypothetical protein